MGAILSRIKKSRDKKKESKPSPSSKPAQSTIQQHQATEQPLLPPSEQAVHDAQPASHHEHLAAVSSPPVPQAAGTEPEDVAGPSNAGQRVVGAGARIPLTTTETTGRDRERELISTTTEGGEKSERKGDGKMATDEDYAAFLDKANADPGEGFAGAHSVGAGRLGLKAVDSGVEVPAVLKEATRDAFYVSDADEPFVPVCLRLSGKGLPDEVAFAKLVSHPSPKDADVSIMDIGEWDTQGEYKDLVEATREATKGNDVRVYRIQKDGSRVEYWVVGVAEGKMVGVKALAIES